jgi:hypothetical protein
VVGELHSLYISLFLFAFGPYGDRARWNKLDSAGSGYDPVAGFCEHGNEPSGFIKKTECFWQAE